MNRHVKFPGLQNIEYVKSALLNAGRGGHKLLISTPHCTFDSEMPQSIFYPDLFLL